MPPRPKCSQKLVSDLPLPSWCGSSAPDLSGHSATHTGRGLQSLQIFALVPEWGPVAFSTYIFWVHSLVNGHQILCKG